MERVTVALFSSRSAAESLANRLAQAGFHPRVSGGSWLKRLWFVRKEREISVKVPGEEFEPAEKFLRGPAATEAALREVFRCPECQSLRVQYPQFARHSMLTNLILGLAAAIRVVEKDYYCESCHFTWPKQGQRKRRDRAHLAPYYFIGGLEQTTLQPPTEPKADEKRKAA